MMSLPVNIIGADHYKKTCSPEERWTAYQTEMLAEKISEYVLDTHINIREIQAGDSLGSLAEGLSKGLIQSPPPSTSIKRTWTVVSEEDALRWEAVKVDYVYFSSVPSDLMQRQINGNPQGVLSEAHLIFPKQFAAFQKPNRIILADSLEDILSAWQSREESPCGLSLEEKGPG